MSKRKRNQRAAANGAQRQPLNASPSTLTERERMFLELYKGENDRTKLHQEQLNKAEAKLEKAFKFIDDLGLTEMFINYDEPNNTAADVAEFCQYAIEEITSKIVNTLTSKVVNILKTSAEAERSK